MSDVRVRRHTDGRYAIPVDTGFKFAWIGVRRGQPGTMWLTDAEVLGEGWSELLVTQLPEPDSRHCDVGRISPQWNLSNGDEVAALPSGVQVANNTTEALSIAGGTGFDELRSDALKMLAAVDACERYRKEAAQ